jgi:hypothetical protein
VRSNPARARELHTPHKPLSRPHLAQEPSLSWTTRAWTLHSCMAGAEGNLHLQPPHGRLLTGALPQASKSTQKRCATMRCACADGEPTGPFARTDTRVFCTSCAHRVLHPQLPRLAGRHLRRSLSPGDPRIPSSAKFGALSRGCLRFVRFYRHLDRGDVFDVSVCVLA